jgi:hypothetical protein
MNLPAEFSNRVVKTRLSGLSASFKKLDEIRKEWQGSEIDVLYEDGRPIVVVVFESEMDCLAFTLKYGKEYA